ncbi:unnamed protein product [Prorocentrum cordatum]|uniref:Uncharacterized protein n=1 Tax=Prorocentrum cordatum TaxID=2364126 RepID=A0ABN9QUI2_9DINO|nr:unnamed protein product [Polarella glacialis]
MALRTKLERALQEARAEIDKLKQHHKQQSTATGNNAAVDMQVDGAHEGGPPEEEQLAEKVKLLEQNLAIAKTGFGSWAEEQQRVLGQQLAEAKQKLLNSKPLHTQVHALANRVKTGAAKTEKAKEAHTRAVAQLEQAQKMLSDASALVEQLQQRQVELEGELGTLQKQLGRSVEAADGYEVMLPSLGVSTSELEAIVAKLAEGGGPNTDAQKRLAEGLGGQINELIAAKKPRISAVAGDVPHAGGHACGEGPDEDGASVSKSEWEPDDIPTAGLI